MIEAFLDFFQLYTVDADYLPDFWLTMILLYLNAGLYLSDLYNLVKRKSKAETFSLMAIPGVFAVIFVSMLSIFAHVPNLQSIASQAKRLSLLITAIQPQTNFALLLIVFLIRFYGESGSYDKGGMNTAAANAGCCPAFLIILHGSY